MFVCIVVCACSHHALEFTMLLFRSFVKQKGYCVTICVFCSVSLLFDYMCMRLPLILCFIAGVPLSQAFPGWLITAPPSICVPAVLGALDVWIQNQKKKRKFHVESSQNYCTRESCEFAWECVCCFVLLNQYWGIVMYGQWRWTKMTSVLVERQDGKSLGWKIERQT